jgi:hypothetical protein
VTNPTKIETIQTHFQALSSAATSLNAASDELTKTVDVLDEALRKLNIGLTLWVTISTWSEEERAGEDQIGYCKVSGKWGIALRYIWGFHAASLDEVDGLWLFNEAPRDLRLAGVDKIPELIEALGKEASETTKQVQEKTKRVRELASVIEKLVIEPKPSTLSERIAAGEKSLKGSGKGSIATLSDIMSSLDQGSK